MSFLINGCLLEASINYLTSAHIIFNVCFELQTLIKIIDIVMSKAKFVIFLNKFLHESVFPHPSIILITFFCILNIVELCDEFPQNIIP
jgi:hypothetical protein